jgi:predicted nucleotide-binding protein
MPARLKRPSVFVGSSSGLEFGRAVRALQSGSGELFGPREDVLFELGLFMEKLGRERTFIFQQDDPNLKVPTYEC